MVEANYDSQEVNDMNGFDNQEPRVNNSFFSQDIFALQENNTSELNAVVPQLHQLLHNERLSPELLPF